MATHSSILAWRIAWKEEPGELHTVHGVTKSLLQNKPKSKDWTHFVFCVLIQIWGH